MAYLVYFEDELLNLREELPHHPALMGTLIAQANDDIYIHIVEIAAYCGIVLDGTYTKDEILQICEKCTEVLVGKRTLIIS